MILIVGLGNPGSKYKNSRHNTGFKFLDDFGFEITKESPDFQMSNKHNAEILRTDNFILAKPMTFMNDSGRAVSFIFNFYKLKPSDIYVVHDDLDISLGEYKIQKGVGPKVHYGIKSIEKELGRSDFWRVRIGIDNRDSENRISGEDYVLQNFSIDETRVLIEVFKNVAKDLLKLINQ